MIFVGMVAIAFGSLGGLLFLGRCLIGVWEGFKMGRADLEWHRVKCVKCGAEIDHDDGVGCRGEP